MPTVRISRPSRRYSTALVPMRPMATFWGVNLDARQHAFGQLCLAPLARSESGMPHIGQLPGSSRMMCGCMGQ